MAVTDQVLKARVERGAALLDAEQPGWCERIDVPTLDMRNGCSCVLGQLYPAPTSSTGYMAGKMALCLAFPETDVPYGFSTPGHMNDARLLPLWREAIEARCEGSGA